MPTRFIPYAKALAHLLCLVPLLMLFERCRSGELGLEPDLVKSLQRFTGDYALWILLGSLAVTPIRRLHHRLSNLIRFRRLLGLYALFYASLHLATYVFFFSETGLQAALVGSRRSHLSELGIRGVAVWLGIWPAIWEDLRKRPFLQVGLFAWAILLALAITSPTVALRRMGGRNWQRLHRLTYAAAIAGCIHFWWLVEPGVWTPLPHTLWLAGLLLARVLWIVRKRRRRLPSAASSSQPAAAFAETTSVAQ